MLGAHCSTPTSFVLYRWANPETTCDYPFLAVAEDGSALLSLGNYTMSFDWGIPDEATQWLESDFVPTGEAVVCDLLTVRNLCDATFAGGTVFGLVTFNSALYPSTLEVSRSTQAVAEAGPEYVVERVGVYRRYHRELDELGPVMPAEQAMLEVCVATFAELAAQCATQLTEPPPPRYRASALEAC